MQRRGRSRRQPPRLAELEALRDHGAHFVLARPDKRPITRDWLNTAPDYEAVLSHVGGGGLLGVVASSLGCVVVDIDKGHPSTVIKVLGSPLCIVKTPRGHHLWYRAPSGEIRNRAWALDGAHGDIRGSKGAIILWDAVAVAAELGDVDNAVPADLSKIPRPPSKRKQRGPDAVRAAKPGERNETLNREVFKAAKAGDLDREAFQRAALQSGLSPTETDATLASAEGAGTKADEAEALSEGRFAREWATHFNEDAYLYAAGEGWLRYQEGRWHDGECTARQTMSELIRGRVKGTTEAKRFDCHRVVCGALAMAKYIRTVPVDSFDVKRLHIPFADGIYAT